MSGSSAAERARELHGGGQLAAAEPLYRAALQAEPQDLGLTRDLAVLLMQARREAEAAALLDRPDLLARADADLLTVLALCLRACGRHERALQVAQQLVTIDAGASLGWLLLGSLQVLLGAAGPGEAALRRCVAIEPALAEAWHYLGESLQQQGRWDEAIAAYGVAARRQPADGINVATCHELAGRLATAETGYRDMLRLMPGRADLLARLAQVQAMQCRFEAEAATTAALAQALGRPLAADDAPEPFIVAWLDLDPAVRAATLRRHARRIQTAVTPLPPAARGPRGGGPLRLGYLSADFGPHAVGELVRGHFAAHDRSRFQVTGYSLRAHQGPVAEEIRRGFDAVVDCDGLSDRAVAEAIRADGIDVLIDMAGFTHGARPRILAMRPAPLQLGWLGFVHGHQAPWLDALLLDEHVRPADLSWPYEDRVVGLPGTLLPGSPFPAGRRNRARFGWPEDAVVLASFNNAYKLGPPLLAAWAEILRRAPRAILVVYLPAAAREGFLRQWSAQGGAGDRLHLVDKLPGDQHADRCAGCDLLLDAFRYQGGATSMQAVASSLPVLTWGGGVTPLQRLGVSLNRFLGLDDLVCPDAGGYVDRAVELCNDSAQLQAVRDRLRVQAAQRGLFDARRAAAAIEQAVLGLVA
ncbi:MAG: tetratricopeptide repeat protein [Rubrivivax sp.]|nr:tetratricopeptide repeat protein [Rubrivivax sp.]